MSSEVVPWHYLRTNASTRYPRRVICLDSEARRRERARGETHTLRCAAASFDLLDPDSHEPVRTERGAFTTPAETWEWIERHTKPKTRTVLWAHNLAYDLRLTDGLAQLARLGWERMFLAIDGARTCGRYRKGTRSLALVDSASFLPAPLADLGSRAGYPKPAMPGPTEGDQAWEAYCAGDVECLRAVVLRLLDWLERADCGMFRLTGPAQAMAVFRHRFLIPGSMLCHRDETALAAERVAAWAGRCEAFRHGPIDGPLHEWDFTLAYLTLARRLWLPVQLWAERDDLTIRQLLQVAKRKRVLAEVEVEQDEPILPTQGEHGILWPVGRFATTCWDVELRAAHERGARIKVGRCWLYRPRPALAGWADWLYDCLGPDGLPSGSLERVLLKAWARSLVGRFGMRVPVWEKIGELEQASLQYLPSVNADTGVEGAILELDHELFERADLVDASDAMPAVTSYIMAAARVRLLEAIEWAGAENVVYADTDSLLATAEGHERLLTRLGDCEREGLREKGSYKRALILGPRQLVLGDELRVAGLPRGAIRRSERVFDAEVWESIAGTLKRGRSNEVRVQRRTIRLRGTDHRRRHLPRGATAPHRL